LGRVARVGEWDRRSDWFHARRFIGKGLMPIISGLT
jgi:hypothetical protein